MPIFKKKWIIFTFCSMTTLLHAAAPTPLTLKYYQFHPRHEYRIKLLELALNKTKATHGNFKLEPLSGEVIVNSRGEDLLASDEIQFAFYPTTKALEEKFIPIRISLLRGIIGYRVFLINQKDIQNFEQIKTLEGLKKLTAGFGTDWNDLPILTHAGLPVVTAKKHEQLFKMLKGQQFDYFPRGLNEAWVEMEKNSKENPDLVVEEHLALYYPLPVYFFVNRKNQSLADRIEIGLKMALADGDFKKLFLQYHEDFIQKAQFDKRKLFVLDNPFLPPGTPVEDTSWWLPQKSSE